MRFLILNIFLLIALDGSAQMQMLRQQKLKQWGIPAGNYSGITPLGNNRYAVVSDKQGEDGFFEWEIVQNETTGRVEHVRQIAFHASGKPTRDAEGIAFLPTRGTVFVAAEDDQQILEYTLQGQRTGRSLQVPREFEAGKIHPNYGFESLCCAAKNDSFSDGTVVFRACTENSVPAEASVSGSANPVSVTLKILSFGADGRFLKAQNYPLDAPTAMNGVAKEAVGVSAMTVSPYGNLLVLEREVYVMKKKIGSFVRCKIYEFSDETAEKSLLAQWTTRLNLTKRNLANYEGMCQGIRLKDGRQTYLLISDSQNGYGNKFFHLKDYIKVAVKTM